MASDVTPEPTPAPNKAQAEFEKYAQRRNAQGGGGPSGGPGGGFEAFPGGGLSWAAPSGAIPIHFGPHPGHGPHGRGGGGTLGEDVGDLASGIGTTLRLGVDLLNAALFNTAKILGGFTGAYGHERDEGCGCGGGCGCCEPSCCEPSCCGCECCSPGVGTCC